MALHVPFWFHDTGAGKCHRANANLCALSLRLWELSVLDVLCRGYLRVRPGSWVIGDRRTGSAWAICTAPYCLCAAIFAFCCSGDEPRSHSYFIEPCDSECCFSDRVRRIWGSGDRIWSTQMFNPKLCKVIIESSLIDLKKRAKNQSSNVCYNNMLQ